MRQGVPNGRRPRGRHHGGSNNGGMNGGSNGGGNGGAMSAPNPMNGGNRQRSAASLRHQTFDSNGPDVRVRGNAWQVYEKYQSLARDASSSGDRIAAENYQQHAEHYYRIIEAINEATVVEQRQRGPSNQQPEVPQNYYAADGTLMPAGNPALTTDSNGNVEQPQMAQAEVQPRNPPPVQQNSFFTDEPEDQSSGPVSLVASR